MLLERLKRRTFLQDEHIAILYKSSVANTVILSATPLLMSKINSVLRYLLLEGRNIFCFRKNILLVWNRVTRHNLYTLNTFHLKSERNEEKKYQIYSRVERLQGSNIYVPKMTLVGRVYTQRLGRIQ